MKIVQFVLDFAVKKMSFYDKKYPKQEDGRGGRKIRIDNSTYYLLV